MKFLRLTFYFFSVIITYVSLSAFEYLVIGAVIDTYTQSFQIKFIAMIACLLIVNPVISYIMTRNIGSEDRINDDDIKLK